MTKRNKKSSTKLEDTFDFFGEHKSKVEKFKNWFYFKAIRPLKFRWQKLTRGWSDEDTWSLDYVIAEFTLPRLKRFKELKNGWPCGLNEKNWDQILDKMMFSLQESINDGNGIVPLKPKASKKQWAAYTKKVMEGRHLFAEYFCNLWW